MKKSALKLPADYAAWITSLKQRIQGARQRALLAANEEQIRLYHDIGRDILEPQSQEGWGAKVIDHLSADLRSAFPGMKGLSSRILKYMKFFAQECPDFPIGQQSAAQLPWFHIVSGIDKPIGVAEYQFVRALPTSLDTALPTIEDSLPGDGTDRKVRSDMGDPFQALPIIRSHFRRTLKNEGKQTRPKECYTDPVDGACRSGKRSVCDDQRPVHTRPIKFQ